MALKEISSILVAAVVGLFQSLKRRNTILCFNGYF